MALLEFVISVEFSDGDVAQLGSGDEVYWTPGEGKSTAETNDERLGFIVRLQQLQASVDEATR